MQGSAVHGFGMRESLWAVGVDAGGRVTDIRWLQPRRMVTLARARLVLELPGSVAPPSVGAGLSIGSG